ncbi:hypothetical protein BDW02DRAFT_572977 [Decorospora gaudefroyi]|uniref:Uncharacterized protein n=1 Tax=Decorospora gaudefroyi TaxID=184978 RepID=A0A6A5K2F3_9PLEO|nr:hypothetical protein BDW02DRAFT_572977 [Decorospora gaudefroyi]
MRATEALGDSTAACAGCSPSLIRATFGSGSDSVASAADDAFVHFRPRVPLALVALAASASARFARAS